MFWSIQTFSVTSKFTARYHIFCARIDLLFTIFICSCYRPWATNTLLHHFGFVMCLNSRLNCTKFSCHWCKIRDVLCQLMQISKRQRDPWLNLKVFTTWVLFWVYFSSWRFSPLEYFWGGVYFSSWRFWPRSTFLLITRSPQEAAILVGSLQVKSRKFGLWCIVHLWHTCKPWSWCHTLIMTSHPDHDITPWSWHHIRLPDTKWQHSWLQGSRRDQKIKRS